MNPPISEEICRKFFNHFESQRRVQANGKVIWVRGNGVMVTDWRALLRYFADQEKGMSNEKPLDLKLRLEALRELEKKHYANPLSANYSGEPSHEDADDFDRIQREIKELEQKMAGR